MSELSNLIEKFKDALDNGNIGAVEKILNENESAYELSDLINSTLDLAASKDDVDLIKRLKSCGAGTDRGYRRALLTAVSGFSVDVAKYLLSEGVVVERDNSRVLLRATEIGLLEIVKVVVEQQSFNEDIINDALVRASSSRRLDVMKFLVEKGGNPHLEGHRLLRNAAINGDIEMAKYLIKQGGDVTTNGNIIIRRLTRRDNLAMIKLFVENGADINVSQGGPLHNAIDTNHPHIIDYLMEQGASPFGRGFRNTVTSNLLVRMVEKGNSVESTKFGNLCLLNPVDREKMILAARKEKNKLIDSISKKELQKVIDTLLNYTDGGRSKLNRSLQAEL